MLSQKGVRQLVFMQDLLSNYKSALLGNRPAPPPHPKVILGRYPNSGLLYAKADVDSLGEITLLEQSPYKSSIFADATRRGVAEISWVMKDGFTGWVVYRLNPQDTEYQVCLGDELRWKLNGLGSMVRGVK